MSNQGQPIVSPTPREASQNFHKGKPIYQKPARASAALYQRPPTKPAGTGPGARTTHSPFNKAVNPYSREQEPSDASSDLSAGAGAFAPSAECVAQEATEAGLDEYGSQVTTPTKNPEVMETEVTDTEDTRTEPSLTPMHHEPTTGAKVNAPPNAPTGSDVSLDTA